MRIFKIGVAASALGTVGALAWDHQTRTSMRQLTPWQPQEAVMRLRNLLLSTRLAEPLLPLVTLDQVCGFVAAFLYFVAIFCYYVAISWFCELCLFGACGSNVHLLWLVPLTQDAHCDSSAFTHLVLFLSV